MFPTDDSALNAVEHALGSSITHDTDGEPVRTGSEFSMQQLLEFYSGYDPAEVVENDGLAFTKGRLYTNEDVIRALIQEVRNLRTQLEG